MPSLVSASYRNWCNLAHCTHGFYAQAFEQAAKEVHELTSKPSNDDLLKLYALYKQATIGDNETCK